MKITRQRLLFEIINFALAILYAAPISLLLERLLFPETRLYMLTAFATLAVLGYIAGRVVLKMDGSVALVVCFVLAAVVAAVILLVLPKLSFFGIIFALYAAALTVYFFLVARKAGYTIYAPFAVSGILIYLFVMIIFYATKLSPQAAELLNYCAVIFFLLSLYALNAKGLRRSLHKGAEALSVKYPQGMQMRNFFLVTGFILLAAIISNIYPLFALFGIIAGYAVKLFGVVFNFINWLFDQRTFRERTVEDDTATEVGIDIFGDIPMHTETTLEKIIFFTVVFACLLVILIVFFRWLNKKLGKSFKGLSALMNRIRNMFDNTSDEDYVDEVENLFGWKNILVSMKDNVLNAVRRVTVRPERIDDMPDNRMKVRFAYKELLKQGQVRSPLAICETPIEFHERILGGNESLEDFIYYYNDARYSVAEIPEQAVSAAKEALKFKIAVKKK